MREVMNVIDKDKNYIYLQTTRTQECESCSMYGGCSMLGGSNELKLKAKKIDRFEVNKGDKVVVELPNVPVVKLSFLAYGLPLIVFLTIVILFYSMNFSDILSFIFGVLGMVVTYLTVNIYDKKKLKDRYLPEIVQKIENHKFMIQENKEISN